MRVLNNIVGIIILLGCIYVNNIVYKNFKAQNIIFSDNKIYHLTYKEVNDLIESIPNISISAMPLAVLRVQYLLLDSEFEKANTYIEKAIKINPHVFIGEYLKGRLFFYQKKYDSAAFYAKKAVIGWPKNIEHYNSYLDILEAKQDTLSLVEIYNRLDSTLKKRPEYFKRFYNSLNKIKLSYLITNYSDERDLSLQDLIGKKWERVYNFPNNQVIKDTSLTYHFKTKNIVANKNNQDFLYKIKKDSFHFYYISQPNTPISSFVAKYSEKFETLIFKMVPVEDNQFQNQYFNVQK